MELASTLDWHKKYVKVIALVLILLIVVYTAFSFGLIKKNCGRDEDCFSDAAEKCKASKYTKVENGNVYNYVIGGKRGGKCKIDVELESMAVGSPIDLVNKFEGKGMECRVPLSELEGSTFDKLNNFISYCTGPLKESIYEQIIVKMYGLIIKNIKDISDVLVEG